MGPKSPVLVDAKFFKLEPTSSTTRICIYFQVPEGSLMSTLKTKEEASKPSKILSVIQVSSFLFQYE